MLCSFQDYPLTWRGLEPSPPSVPQVSRREEPWYTPWGTEVVAVSCPLPSLTPIWLPLPSLALEGPSPFLTQSAPAPINMGCPDQGHPWRSPWESTGRGQRCLSRSKWLLPSWSAPPPGLTSQRAPPSRDLTFLARRGWPRELSKQASTPTTFGGDRGALGRRRAGSPAETWGPFGCPLRRRY